MKLRFRFGRARYGRDRGPRLNRVTAWHFMEEHPSDSKVIEEYSTDVPNGMGLSHIKLLQKTFDNLSKAQLEAPVSVESGNRTTELIHALYSSEEIGGWVSMAHKPESNDWARRYF